MRAVVVIAIGLLVASALYLVLREGNEDSGAHDMEEPARTQDDADTDKQLTIQLRKE